MSKPATPKSQCDISRGFWKFSVLASCFPLDVNIGLILTNHPQASWGWLIFQAVALFLVIKSEPAADNT